MANGNPAQGNSLDTIAIRITASSAGASHSIDRLTTSLTNLRAVVSSSLSGLSALAGTIGNLSSSLRTLGSNTDNVRGFRNALNRLSQVDLNNVSRNIRELSALNFDIAGLREAVRELSGFSRGMNQVNPSLERGAVHANRFSLGLGGLKGVISAIVSSRIIGAMKQMVASTNNYIEAMNLAKVSLGGFFESANAFSENVSSALGIDQGTLLENMGLFQNLATSFGVSADNAYVLSKNMSQLAYDFASFHNLNIEESFLKFQSALAGELEPIRRSGVDISNARLQQELYDLGLQQNISTLNRADKAILTYIAIMKQSTNEMGDMARTIQSPANMLRVLGNQATITGRQIGALFIPALQEILPWAIAVMKVIGQLASTLASLAGFNLNDYLADVDGSAFEGMAGDIEDIGTAAGKADKKMNNLIGGFDELNILKKASASGTGANVDSLLGGLDLSKLQYDMLGGLTGGAFDKYVREVTDFLDAFKNSAAVKATTQVLDFLWRKVVKPFGTWVVNNPDAVANWLLSIGTAVASYKLASAIGNLASGFGNLRRAVSAGGLASGLRVLSGVFTNPWAIAIGAVAAAIVGVGVAVWQSSEKAKKARLDEIFGDLTLTFEETQKAAKALSSTELSFKLDTYTDERSALSKMYESVQDTLQTLKSQQWLASIGVDIDLEAYSVSTDTLITQTQEALNQQEHVYTMAISLGVSSENVAAEMETFVAQYMNQSRFQLESLGKQLRATVDNAMADGVLSGDELQTIANLQAEMQEVLNQVAQAEYTAQWKALTMDYSGVDLTFDSWSQVMDETNAMIEDQLKNLEAVRIQDLQIAELALQSGEWTQEQYDATVAEIQRTFMENKMSLTVNLDQFAIDTMNDSYQNAITSFGENTAGFISEVLGDEFAGLFGDDQKGPVRELNVSKLMIAIEQEVQNNIPSLRNAIGTILENIKPQESEWLAQKAYYEEMGMEVPKTVTAGLENIERLRELGGSTEGMFNTIRDTLINSSQVKEAMAQAGLTADDLVGTFVEGIWNGNTYAANAGSGLVGVTTAAVEQKVIDDAATVKDAGKDVGDNFWDGLKEKWNSIRSWWQGLDLGSLVGTSSYYSNRTRTTTSSGGIPQLASGNVATDPTLAVFGEYPGAKQNPEITAPQSTIYETVVAANTEMVGAVYQMASMIVQAIENNATEVSADSEGIFKAVRKGAAEYKKTHGASAF